MSLEEQSLSRKQKLNLLAKRKQESETKIEEDDETNPSSKRSKKLEFRFRNYDPSIHGPKRHDDSNIKDTVEETVKDVMENVKREDEIRRAGELELTKIQPKKPNWDLKRDLMKKTSKLDPITQAAFATLIRRRMQAAGSTTADEGTAAALVKEINKMEGATAQESDQSSDED
ncbi:hypothetical protein O181_042795 [Austropuccinia psidii MF-1]|uniref:Coiled-coil domain-containing protein 12 n=1 Tax=Austropuccinia psidii MF-1 TaxID=1389203 RepID=A0A9Q3HII7_9BASI|nr:hypothetical protein [Austropuccinia psidii MF-1]